MTNGNISPAGGPLRRRMAGDMTVRGFTASTQRGYIRAVGDFTAFFGRSPDRAGAEDLRRYQLHMRSIGASATSMNAAVSALRFFFGVTLGRGDAQVGMTTVREPRKLPVVLSTEEVARLLDAAQSSSPGGLKYKAALSVAYGAGPRASEVVSRKVSDIDSERMVVRVEQGISLEGKKVTFKWKDTRAKDGDLHKTMALPIPEFIRRFLIHVLPQGFHRIRHYGLFANGGRTRNIALARELLAMPAPEADDTHSADDTEPPALAQPCPCCGGPMIILETFERGGKPRAPPTAGIGIAAS